MTCELSASIEALILSPPDGHHSEDNTKEYRSEARTILPRGAIGNSAGRPEVIFDKKFRLAGAPNSNQTFPCHHAAHKSFGGRELHQARLPPHRAVNSQLPPAKTIEQV